MSRYITSLRIAIATAMLLFATAGPAAAQGYQDYQDNQSSQNYDGGNASYQQFYDDLSPYGEWINDPEYGYVWIPDAGSDFRPYYTNGYWANTDYGNTWVSNYDWGWAPFHYGRWTYSNSYGWIWLPGNEWGPAWVSWRAGGGSYGWAPLGPGVSIGASFGNYYAPDYWWVFTPQQYILSPNFHQYCYGPRYNSNYIRQTTIINNTYVRDRRTYIAGPRRNELERAIGRPVQSYSINNIDRPDRAQIRGNNLAIYRPGINETRPRPTERPRQVTDAREPIRTAPREMAQPDRTIGRDRGNTPINQLQPQQQPLREGVQQRNDRIQLQERAPINQQPDRNQGRQPARQIETQQRSEQIQRNQLLQQQRDVQMQQQRNQQVQQQRDAQMQQQRNQQMQQQRNQQVQQQRDVQMQQQRNQLIQQQRNQQVQQQRVEQRRVEAPQAQPQRIERQAPEQRPQPAPRQEAPQTGERPEGRGRR